MALMGSAQPRLPQYLQMPQVDIPVQAPSSSGSPLAGLLGLGGLALGAQMGGVEGARLGYGAGATLPFMFG